MLDIDYCNGQDCSMKQVCQRYADYLYKQEHQQDTRYARNGQGPCEQFNAKAYTGN